MELNVTFRHMESSDPLKKHIETGLQKLDKYSFKPESAHFVLDAEKFRHRAEITLINNGNRLTAIEESENMYESIDGALAKIAKQLKKSKAKIKSHKL